MQSQRINSSTHNSAHQSPGVGPDFAQYRQFFWRDSIIALVTACLWLNLSSLPSGGALACGLLTGICALQLHEWGHVWGAFRSNADIYPPRHWWHPFIFSLDHNSNTREQFLAVSLPAFAATAVYISVFALVLPKDNLAGQTAMIMGSITAGLTVIIELPLFIRVYRGKPLPPVELFKRSN